MANPFLFVVLLIGALPIAWGASQAADGDAPLALQELGLGKLHWHMSVTEARQASPLFDSRRTRLSKQSAKTSLLEVNDYPLAGCRLSLKMRFDSKGLNSIALGGSSGHQPPSTCVPLIERELLNRFGVPQRYLELDGPARLSFRWRGAFGIVDFKPPTDDRILPLVELTAPQTRQIAEISVLGLRLDRLRWDMPIDQVKQYFPDAEVKLFQPDWLEVPFNYADCDFRLRFNFQKDGLNAVWFQNQEDKPKPCAPQFEKELFEAFGVPINETDSTDITALNWSLPALHVYYFHTTNGWLVVEFNWPEGIRVAELDLR